jgi:hypothetical protein
VTNGAPDRIAPPEEAGVESVPDAPLDQRRWGAAAALTAVVLVVGVADPFVVVAVPFGLLLIAFRRRGWGAWAGLAIVLFCLVLAPGGGLPGSVVRGWALLLGASLIAVTLIRPDWRAFERAFGAVAVAVAATGIALSATGSWFAVDGMMAAHFQGMAPPFVAELNTRFPDSGWSGELGGAVERMVELWAVLFPGLLTLQSVAALALVQWAFGRANTGSRPLGLLREFRFHDALVWVAVVGLAAIAFPLGDGAARLGYNLLVVMGALYAVRGIGVFLYLGRGSRSVASVVLGTLALVLFFQFIRTAAVIVGLGDTWLDVRGRAGTASRA